MHPAHQQVLSYNDPPNHLQVLSPSNVQTLYNRSPLWNIVTLVLLRCHSFQLSLTCGLLFNAAAAKQASFACSASPIS